jgi:hypothetical protein
MVQVLYSEKSIEIFYNIIDIIVSFSAAEKVPGTAYRYGSLEPKTSVHRPYVINWYGRSARRTQVGQSDWSALVS